MFNKQNPDASLYNIEAYVCVGTIGVRPSTRASDANVQLQFAQCNADIFEGTTKDF